MIPQEKTELAPCLIHEAVFIEVVYEGDQHAYALPVSIQRGIMADHKAGLSAEEIAAKRDISAWTVRKYTKGVRGGR